MLLSGKRFDPIRRYMNGKTYADHCRIAEKYL